MSAWLGSAAKTWLFAAALGMVLAPVGAEAAPTSRSCDGFDRLRVVDEPGAGQTLHGCGVDGARQLARINVPAPGGSGLGGVPEVLYLHQGIGHGPGVLTDGAGELVEERHFEPYGAPLWAGADYAVERLGWNGKAVDPSTGWSDHGARWNGTEFAHWLAPDPPLMGPAGWVEHGLAATPYGFVAGNPVMMWDPDGRRPDGDTPLHDANLMCGGRCSPAEWNDLHADLDQAYEPIRQASRAILAGTPVGPALSLAEGDYWGATIGALSQWVGGAALKALAAVEIGAATAVSPPAQQSVGAARGIEPAKGGLGRLNSTGPGQWRSSGGVIYGQGSAHGNRVEHVLAHTIPDPSKPLHSVFNVGRHKVLGLVDEAWTARGASLPGDPGAFVVPMGRTVGTAGETGVKIVVKPGTSEIITAYPVFP